MTFAFLAIIFLGWISLMAIGVIYRLSLPNKRVEQELYTELAIEQTPNNGG